MRASPKVTLARLPRPPAPAVTKPPVTFEPFDIRVVDAWNRGLTEAEIVHEFRANPRDVKCIIDKARGGGLTLRRAGRRDANAQTRPGLKVSLARVPSLERPL